MTFFFRNPSRRSYLRKLRNVAITLALAGTAVVGVQTPAHAWIDYCTGHQTNVSLDAYCEGTRPSSFAASAWCRYSDGRTYLWNGPWQWAGEQVHSSLTCHAGSFIVDAWISKNDA